MTRLLHVSSSPRGAASESLAIADAFLDSYRDAHPGAAIDTFDLWDGSLPAFGPDAAAAKMTVFAGQTPTGTQVAAWQAAKDTSPGSPPPTSTCSPCRCGTPACPTS
jgi:FMN-dependent NADH-azoreductase